MFVFGFWQPHNLFPSFCSVTLVQLAYFSHDVLSEGVTLVCLYRCPTLRAFSFESFLLFWLSQIGQVWTRKEYCVGRWELKHPPYLALVVGSSNIGCSNWETVDRTEYSTRVLFGAQFNLSVNYWSQFG